MTDQEQRQLMIELARARFPRLMAVADRIDRILTLHQLAWQFPFGESFFACIWLDSFAGTLIAGALQQRALTLACFGLFVYSSWVMREQLLVTYWNWIGPPKELLELEDDELLSMGQSYIVDYFGRDCDASLFLQGPDKRSPEGTLYRQLALYDVRVNKLGVPMLWPGKDSWPPLQRERPHG